MNAKETVLVLFGGQSSEYEVSLVSSSSVIQNLDTNRFQVVTMGVNRQGEWLLYEGSVEHIIDGTWEERAKQQSKAFTLNQTQTYFHPSGFLKAIENRIKQSIDVVFPVMHGTFAEDGALQGLLNMAQIPYVGCGVMASSLGMDKEFSKRAFLEKGIPVGPYLTFRKNDIISNQAEIIIQIENTLGYPCFVKPANTGSSVGISKAHSKVELEDALRTALLYDKKIVVEGYIWAREVECAVLGLDHPKVSVVGEIIPGNEFYDYDAKYHSNKTQMIIPADLPNEVTHAIQEYSKLAFQSIECSGLSRVDFFVEKDTNKIYINEINTMPGFTSVSMYPKLWEATGLSYQSLLTQLIELAKENFIQNKRNFYK